VSFLRHSRAAVKLFGLSASLSLVLAIGATSARADFSDYGFASASASVSTSQAGAHPDMTLQFALKTDPASLVDPTGLKKPYAKTQDLVVNLPPGLIGNPNAIPRCSMQRFVTFLAGGSGCEQDSQVGVSSIGLYEFLGRLTEPVYNMEVPSNDTVARLGFYAGALPYFINISVRSGGDYGLTAKLEGIPAVQTMVSATTELWGVPADSTHNTLRLTPKEAYPEFKSESPPRSSGLAPAPFMTNPVNCEGPLTIGLTSDSYQLPGQFSAISAPLPAITGCGKVDFQPGLTVTPTSREAAAPTGLDATLTIPQNETHQGIATGQLRDATVTLPKGMTIASGAADGLQACSSAQVRLGEDVAAACPDAAKIGTAEFDVPALSRRVQGALYQRTPEPGNLFRIWLVADELGVHVKIPGEIHADPGTGQISSIFLDNPRVPVRELKLHFKSGSKGVLANPASCGTYATSFQFTPWSSPVPIAATTPMTIDQSCATGGFSPGLSAGTTSPSAGSFSSFAMDVTRKDGEQNISGLSLTMPPGLLGKLAGIPLCPEAEATSGTCSAASQVGTTTVAAGPGPTPLWIPQPGKAPTAVYLGGPYKGAPYSLIVVTPAQAGPFDLGTVVVRAAISVDPTTAQVSVKSDPLPQILEGVPVSYRDIHVDVNRQKFILNPTSCDPMSIEAQLTSPAGASAGPSSRFQAASCASLGFKPRLSTKLSGGTRRGAYPALRAELKARPGDANIARAAVTLPHSEFLAQNHIRTVCTRVQFRANRCPAGSIYGHVRAISPLLDLPLEGPVYLRSSSNPLPDLVGALRGQVDLDIVGRIDSVNGGIRTTFETVPDAPVSKFVITMKGGRKGLLVNSRNLCASPSFSVVKFDGQNGKTADQRPRLKNSCGAKSRRESG